MEIDHNMIDKLQEKLKKIDFNESFLDGCNRRRKFLGKLIDTDNFYGSPEFAVYYFEEAIACYVYGQFIACILICQLVCSEMLKFYYRCAPGNIDVVNQYGFKKLINRALSDKFISKELANKLHEIRRFRNLLEHTKDYTDNETCLLGFRIRFESEELATDSMKLAVNLKESLSWHRFSQPIK